MTKTLDQLLFAFYNKNDGAADHRPAPGHRLGHADRPRPRRDERLINRFDYDGDYGTVLNRFLMQAAIGYPLTVHGTGGQTRAFIHIQDTVRCIELAIEQPAGARRAGADLQPDDRDRTASATWPSWSPRLTGAEIDLVDNPRKEATENELLVDNKGLLDLGLEPITLEDDLLREVTQIASRYLDRVDRARIPCTSRWTRSEADAQVPPLSRS